MHHLFSKITILLGLIHLANSSIVGQNQLSDWLALAEKNHPAILAKQARAEALRLDQTLQKNTLLPSLDLAYQANYATFNNITGMNFPALLLPISGPPSNGNDFGGVFGSAASLLFKWSPFTFGQQALRLDYQQKDYERLLAGVANEKLRLKFAVAGLYLDLAHTRELLRSYDKNIERNESNLQHIRTLARVGIHPGVDSLRFQGELSRARSERMQLQALLQQQVYAVQELLASEQVIDIDTVSIPVGKLPQLAPGSNASTHPVLQIAQGNLALANNRLEQIQTSWRPKIELWSTLYARGSGVDFLGQKNAFEGLGFSRFNYGLGFQVAFTLLEKPNLSAKAQQQAIQVQAAQAEIQQVQNHLKQELASADNQLRSTLQIAQELPLEYQANEAVYQSIQTRYRSGLVDYTQLIQAQYNLLQSEVRLRSAIIQCWKALLQVALAQGDLGIFQTQFN